MIYPPFFERSRKLFIACRSHVLDMASRNFMAHVGSDGSTPSIRAMRAGYNWRAIAENVAAGQKNWRSVLTAWFKSPGHRSNLLSSATTEFAAAHCEANNGKIFWAQCFGRSF
ncbi:hypothetical protein HMI56_006080 [Coelomomyces lativittatus]|nr:hypothetical protein HMI56_006080 [Coelomomyces lativittatus]